jgi:hypothetical protein
LRSPSWARPDNASYRRYADLKRGAAVWNVVAAPELSLELKTWCFAVVGCVGYRGYYDRAEAEAFAAGLLAQERLDVSVYPVPAYSTLGKLPAADWLADPLLNTFIDYPEGDLARLIFHELAHQVAFAPGDTLFNESFASAVEKIGLERWLGRPENAQARLDYARSESRRADFRDLTSRYRDELLALYRSDAPESARREGKAAVMGPAARRLRGAEGRPMGRLRRLRPLVRRGQQRLVRRARQLHLAGAGVRAAVRAGRPRLRALLRRGPSPRRSAGRAAAGSSLALRQQHPGGTRHGRHPHPPQPWPRPGQGAQDRLEMGRDGGREVRHGMHGDRRRGQRRRRVHPRRRGRPAAGHRQRPSS